MPNKKWKKRPIRPMGVHEAYQKRRRSATIHSPEISVPHIQDISSGTQDMLRDLSKLQKLAQEMSFYLAQLTDE